MNAITWYDNIPLLSWLILGAKCRNCKAPISWQYPLVEAITGVLFVAVYLRFGLTLATPVYMVMAAAMVVVTFQDLADWTIPDEITKTGVPIGLGLSVVALLMGDESLLVTHPFDAILGIVLGFAVLFGLDRITVLLMKKPGMGMGDVKLLAMLGAFIGWQGVLGTLMLASVLGSTIGLAVLLYFRMKGGAESADVSTVPDDEGSPEEGDESTVAKVAETDEEDDDGISLDHRYLPFGPYLAIGGLVYIFVGPQVLAWYLASLTLPY